MGTRYSRLDEALLTSTHNLCFEQKFEKYPNFYLKIFHFLVVKLLVYFNKACFGIAVILVLLETYVRHNYDNYQILEPIESFVGCARLAPV